jgi:hypothetical protein
VNITAPPTLPITNPTTPAELIYLDRANNTKKFFTEHVMATTYLYNSLNQLVRQSMPDHDLMNVWEYTLPNGLDSRLKVTATQFVNSTKGYLSGTVDIGTGAGAYKRGYLYTTEDAGATWSRMSDLVGSDLKKIQLLDDVNGFAMARHCFVD